MEPYHLERNTRMKKATKQSSSSEITVTISRLGEEEIEVTVGKDATVGEVVEQADLDLSSSEKLYVNSEEAKDHYVIDDGDHVAIIGKKEGGIEDDAPAEDAPSEDAPAESTEDAPAE